MGKDKQYHLYLTLIIPLFQLQASTITESSFFKVARKQKLTNYYNWCIWTMVFNLRVPFGDYIFMGRGTYNTKTYQEYISLKTYKITITKVHTLYTMMM